MKYVVINRRGLETPVIFSEIDVHADHVRAGDDIISAGFCRFAVNPWGEVGVGCWGESIGLGVKSRFVEDENVILRHHEFRS